MISPSELIRHPGPRLLVASGVQPTPARLADPDEVDEYAPIDLAASWSVLSLLTFGMAILARALAERLPRDVLQLPRMWRALVPGALCTVLLTAGLLFALLGLRQARRRASGIAFARFAFGINLIGLILASLAIAAILWIAP